MDHLQSEQDSRHPAGSGFSATLELAEIEPLITLIRRLGCDAELRVHGVDGGSGHLLYAAGELASGTFDGLSGPPAVERVLALRGGALQLEVSQRRPRLEGAAPPEAPAPAPEAQRSALEPEPRRAPDTRGSLQFLPGERATQAHTPSFGSSLQGPAFAGVLRGSGFEPFASGGPAAGPSPVARWLWALAPALAIAVWIASEIVERLSHTAEDPAAPSAQPHEAQSR